MPRQQLQQALETLHRELESEEALSAEDRASLIEAVNDIKHALSPEQNTEGLASGALSNRVYALIEELETTHPKFADILRNVSESLSNLGI
ncbi:MAG: DUF4404 family protein [Myxococcota bacterium]